MEGVRVVGGAVQGDAVVDVRRRVPVTDVPGFTGGGRNLTT